MIRDLLFPPCYFTFLSLPFFSLNVFAFSYTPTNILRDSGIIAIPVLKWIKKKIIKTDLSTISTNWIAQKENLFTIVYHWQKATDKIAPSENIIYMRICPILTRNNKYSHFVKCLFPNIEGIWKCSELIK